MFTKRIIPCLDVHEGRVVKGVNFVNLRDAGDPVEIAAAYDKAGADEVVFLDITASSDARKTVVDMVRRVAEKVFIPFTVGGGIRTVDDFKAILREGADKVSVNSSAIMRPELISEAADKFGSQCVVVAIDAKRRADGSGWNIYKNGGRVDMKMDAVEWAMRAEKLGAGEILLTSMDCDGTKAGYDLELTRAVAEAVNIPVIGNGDILSAEDAKKMIDETGCDAVMIGRGTLGNPYLIKQIVEYLKTGELLKDQTPIEKMQTCLKHFDYLLKIKPEKVAVLEMRTHGAWYLKGLPNGVSIKKRLYEIKTKEEFINTIKEYMENLYKNMI